MAEKEYIERESLLDRVYAVRDKLQLDLNNPFEDGVRIGFENVEMEIENYPAADVRPVRYGRWGVKNECSECGCQPWFERDIHTLNFCPNCGADMREES